MVGVALAVQGAPPAIPCLRRGYFYDKDAEVIVTARFFGFWLPVHGAKTAEAAIRMAELPVFLLGLCLLAGQFGRFAILLGGRNLALLLPVALIVLAFRLRAGGTAFAPLATGLGVAGCAGGCGCGVTGWRANFSDVLSGAGKVRNA